MNLQFDSIGELEEFLMFTAHIGRAFATAPIDQMALSANVPQEMRDALTEEQAAKIGAGNETDAVPVAAGAASVTDTQGEDGALLADGGASAEAPKRKRRTKAEIEAERAAASYIEVAKTTHADGSVTTTSVGLPPDVSPNEVTTPSGNPFAVAPAMQAVLDAPNQGAATLAGMAATQNVSTAPVLDVRARAAAILADPAQVESIAHLRACQGFIQKHGMPKYNESFREGLNANIAVYQPDQRALHLAILESLDA